MPLLFIFIFLFTQTCPAGSANEGYLNELIENSSGLNLHSARDWEVLLHYKKGLWGSESLIDDPLFFLSPKGKTNPKSELEATIHSFFKEFIGEKSHSRCLFPARYEWLKEKLDIDEDRLPQVRCREMDEIMSKVNPKSAVLVFPAAYMNSPASMFGHTLIRLDSDYKSKLLSYSVSYAATTNETNGLAFAFKGIFGYYRGNYTILPYYDKVKEYNNMDQRDIWEYELNLTEDEVRKMFLHVWELKDVYSWYYFFDENCAYQLLFLIEAARPSLHMTDSFFYWVNPIDTIKAVSDNDLIKSVNYRPSISSRIKGMLSDLDPDTQERALKRAKGDSPTEEIIKSSVERDKKILAIDLATEIIQYSFSKNELPKEEYKKRLIKNLAARSSLGKASDGSFKLHEPSAPQAGHGSSRFSIRVGQREDLTFSEIKFRPAYQTLMDPDEGYHRGSQVVFFDLTARYYEDIGLEMERFDVIDLFSVSPRNKFFKPLSWKVATGIRSKTLSDHKRHHTYFVNPGFGYAFENEWLGLYYMMGEFDIDVSENLDKDYAVSIGSSAGLIKNVTDWWKLHLFAKRAFFEIGDKHREDSLAFLHNFKLNRSNSISLDLNRERTFGITEDEAKVGWNLYF